MTVVRFGKKTSTIRDPPPYRNVIRSSATPNVLYPAFLRRLGPRRAEVLTLCEGPLRGSRRAERARASNGGYRRVSPVPPLPGECPFTEQPADAQRGRANRNRVRSAGQELWGAFWPGIRSSAFEHLAAIHFTRARRLILCPRCCTIGPRPCRVVLGFRAVVAA